MDSIWTEHVALPQFPTLEGDVKTDVLIIGGGMAGILCAYFLQEQGVDYILVEGRTICSGITKNTTAKLTALHGLIYDRLLKQMGAEKAKMYLDANQEALRQYESLCRNMDCEFERRTAYTYSLDDPGKLEQEVDALSRLGCSAELTETTELPFPTAGAVALKDQAQFHPLKFAAGIGESLHIYEHTFVRELTEHTAVTDRGRIWFQQAVFATHFPIENKHGLYFMKMYQHRSYVIALENAGTLKGMYVDEAGDGMSFRSCKDLLLVGGGGHRTGKAGGNWEELRKFAGKYYPQAAEHSFWANQDCMTLDGVPYIGPYSGRRTNWFVASGFQKWGMTSSMAAAGILTDLILGRENPYAEVFAPSRTMMRPQLLINGWESTINLLTISAKRCPHLGCALKWNPAEHSWDCPCHGSRFDERGVCLDNPANGDRKS